MKLKLPENFGGASVEGEPIELNPDANGVVNVEEPAASVLVSFGATPVADEPSADDAASDEAPARKRK